MPFTAYGVAAQPQTPYLPPDNSLLMAAGDPATAGSGVTLTAGQLLLARLSARSAVTLNNLWFEVTTAGAGASTGSFAGVYSSAGTLLSGSADIGALLLVAGPMQVPLSSPVQVAAGAFVWAAIVTNLATTQVTLSRWGIGSVLAGFGGATAATYRWAINGAGLSALPGAITPASNLGTTSALLVGAS